MDRPLIHAPEKRKYHCLNLFEECVLGRSMIYWSLKRIQSGDSEHTILEASKRKMSDHLLQHLSILCNISKGARSRPTSQRPHHSCLVLQPFPEIWGGFTSHHALSRRQKLRHQTCMKPALSPGATSRIHGSILRCPGDDGTGDRKRGKIKPAHGKTMKQLRKEGIFQKDFFRHASGLEKPTACTNLELFRGG